MGGGGNGHLFSEGKSQERLRKGPRPEALCSLPQDRGEDSRRTTHIFLQQGTEKGANIPIP